MPHPRSYQPELPLHLIKGLHHEAKLRGVPQRSPPGSCRGGLLRFNQPHGDRALSGLAMVAGPSVAFHLNPKGKETKTMSPQMGDLLVNEVVPRLRATASRVPAIGHEDREELLADMTANAAKMMDSAEKAGKRFSAGNVAYFASRAARSGRRSTWSGRTDVMSPAAALDHSVRLERLDGCPGRSSAQPRPDFGDSAEGLHEIVWTGNAPGSCDPADEAARNIAWEEFLALHPPRYRIAVLVLAGGGTMREAGRSCGIGDSAACQLRKSLRAALQEHFGAEIIANLLSGGVRSSWESDLRASRERHLSTGTLFQHEPSAG